MSSTQIHIIQALVLAIVVVIASSSLNFMMGIQGQIEKNRHGKAGPQTMAEWFVFNAAMRSLHIVMRRQLSGDPSHRTMLRWRYKIAAKFYRMLISLFKLSPSVWAYVDNDNLLGWLVEDRMIYLLFKRSGGPHPVQINLAFCLRGGKLTEIRQLLMNSDWLQKELFDEVEV